MNHFSDAQQYGIGMKMRQLAGGQLTETMADKIESASSYSPQRSDGESESERESERVRE